MQPYNKKNIRPAGPGGGGATTGAILRQTSGDGPAGRRERGRGSGRGGPRRGLGREIPHAAAPAPRAAPPPAAPRARAAGAARAAAAPPAAPAARPTPAASAARAAHASRAARALRHTGTVYRPEPNKKSIRTA